MDSYTACPRYEAAVHVKTSSPDRVVIMPIISAQPVCFRKTARN